MRVAAKAASFNSLAHWASASLFPPLAALGSAPLPLLKKAGENQPAGIRTVYRIGLSLHAILIYDHMGRVSQALPYTLAEQRLSIDYGQPLGILEYQPRP